MSKREDKDEVVNEEPSPSEDTDENPDSPDSKIISKGKAKLIIAGTDEAHNEADTPRHLTPEPRVMSARLPVIESQEEINENEIIQRLEREVNPGKERIKIDTAKFEERQERPDEAEIQEEQWGGVIISGWWIAIAGAGAAVILLGGLAIKSWMDGDTAEDVSPAPAYVPSKSNPYDGSPEKWFHEKAGKISEDALVLLKAFLSTKDKKAQSAYLRFPNAYLKEGAESSVALHPRLSNTNEHTWLIDHTKNTAFLILQCRDTGFMPFRAYFTRENNQLKLDWKATSAWCEVSLKTIKADIELLQSRVQKIKHDNQKAENAYAAAIASRAKALEALHQQIIRKKNAQTPNVHIVRKGENVAMIARRHNISVKELMERNQLVHPMIQIGQKLNISPAAQPVAEVPIVVPPMPDPVVAAVYPPEIHTEPILVRCLLSRRDEFYTDPYHERMHSAFMLRSSDKLHYLWAYVARDSPLDLDLRRLLDHGRFVVKLKKDLRVTLRIRRSQKDALPSQVELVEIVQPEWVTP